MGRQEKRHISYCTYASFLTKELRADVRKEPTSCYQELFTIEGGVAAADEAGVVEDEANKQRRRSFSPTDSTRCQTPI